MMHLASSEDRAMLIDELEVYITPDGLGRAAIVRRSDGLLSIFVHWNFAPSAMKALGWVADNQVSWADDKTPLSLLYEDREPEVGIYGTLDDARRQIRTLPGFSDAALKPAD
jgi:hypothetical protein